VQQVAVLTSLKRLAAAHSSHRFSNVLTQLTSSPHTLGVNAEAEGKSKCTAAHWCSKKAASLFS